MSDETHYYGDGHDHDHLADGAEFGEPTGPSRSSELAEAFVPDGSTEADLKAQWEAASMNRADRRRTEREERRAAKLATIQAISRGLR